MNRPTARALVFGIILLVLVIAAFASTADASKGDPGNLLPPRVLAMQGPPVSYTLTINVVGSGSVTKNPNQPVYISGTVVALTAVPDPGATFSGWSGDLTGSTNPQNLTMTKNMVVTATFTTAVCYSLTTHANPGSGGSISPNPAANCNGGTQYGSGTTVNLTANANSGFAFSNWSGGASGSTNPVSVLMDATKVVTANFATCYTLNTAVSPGGSGSVTVNTAANCGTQYVAGTVVNLTANASSGYTFSSWTNASGTAGAGTVTMNTNTTVTANFSPVSQPPAQPTATNTTAPAATSQPLATITPLLGGVVATATLTPKPPSTLPTTGSSPLTWIAVGLVLVLILAGARYMRQSSS